VPLFVVVGVNCTRDDRLLAKVEDSDIGSRCAVVRYPDGLLLHNVHKLFDCLV
jgi:hypothetical protein